MLAFAPSFVHASDRTSERYVPGVVLTTARRAVESMTTTLVAMMAGWELEVLGVSICWKFVVQQGGSRCVVISQFLYLGRDMGRRVESNVLLEWHGIAGG